VQCFHVLSCINPSGFAPSWSSSSISWSLTWSSTNIVIVNKWSDHVIMSCTTSKCHLISVLFFTCCMPVGLFLWPVVKILLLHLSFYIKIHFIWKKHPLRSSDMLHSSFRNHEHFSIRLSGLSSARWWRGCSLYKSNLHSLKTFHMLFEIPNSADVSLIEGCMNLYTSNILKVICSAQTICMRFVSNQSIDCS
jgi:hypothetical protein